MATLSRSSIRMVRGAIESPVRLASGNLRQSGNTALQTATPASSWFVCPHLTCRGSPMNDRGQQNERAEECKRETCSIFADDCRKVLQETTIKPHEITSPLPKRPGCTAPPQAIWCTRNKESTKNRHLYPRPPGDRQGLPESSVPDPADALQFIPRSVGDSYKPGSIRHRQSRVLAHREGIIPLKRLKLCDFLQNWRIFCFNWLELRFLTCPAFNKYNFVVKPSFFIQDGR